MSKLERISGILPRVVLNIQNKASGKALGAQEQANYVPMPAAGCGCVSLQPDLFLAAKRCKECKALCRRLSKNIGVPVKMFCLPGLPSCAYKG